jgi:hypothetical protein
VSEVEGALSGVARVAPGCEVEGEVDALAPKDGPHPKIRIDTVRATARHPNFANVYSCLF